MINLNDTLTVNITDTGINGTGITRIDNSVVFVNGAVEGDTAEIRITGKRKNYYTADTVHILVSSSFRDLPRCSICSDCGGCSLSGVTFDYENTVKERTVKKALRQFGLDYSLVSEIRHAAGRYSYRNKITLHYDVSTASVGYYKPETNDIVPVSECVICSENINNVLPALSKNVKSLASHGLKEIKLQSSSCNDDVFVTVISDDGCDVINISDLLNAEYSHCVNTAVSDKKIRSEIGKLIMHYSPDAFRQVNEECFAFLLDEILDIVSPVAPGKIVDLYCGSGIIGLTCAAAFPSSEVFGVEINPSSISDAKINAQINTLENISFHCGSASEFIKHMPESFSPEIIIVDPPRSGLNKQTISEIQSLDPHLVIYVSCNPFTMARDIKTLEPSYVLKTVKPYNMFPCTEHVETVCKLVLRYPVTHINIDVDVQEMVQEKRGQATYSQIKEYVQKQTGLKVSTLYISQIKRKCGLDVGDSYNKPKSEDARVAQCPQEKEKAIMGALSHFGMI